MRLVRSALAVSCLLAGLWLILRALGLLLVVLHSAGRWWPTFLLAAGVAILLRSFKPGPHVAASVGLIGAGCMAFAITRRIIAKDVWTFVLAGGLIFVGIMLIYFTVSTRSDGTKDDTGRISVSFRAAEIMLKFAELKRIRVFLLCGRLELDLRDAIPPGQRRDAPLMIEITAWVGNVRLLVPAGVHVVSHEAFVLRFRKPIQLSVLDEQEEETMTAHVVAATLAFFGKVEFNAVPR